jgi:hypothetical protein
LTFLTALLFLCCDRFSYRKTLLQRSLRALAASHKVSLILYPSGVLFLQCMLVAPPQPEAGNYTEAERARRKAEREMRKRGEVTDGIVELRVSPSSVNASARACARLTADGAPSFR